MIAAQVLDMTVKEIYALVSYIIISLIFFLFQNLKYQTCLFLINFRMPDSLARNHAHIPSSGMLVVIIAIVRQKNATMSMGVSNEKLQVR